jgi:K+-sensing histidine kinase KdpD
MATAITKVGPQNLGQRLPLEGLDGELRVLAGAVNDGQRAVRNSGLRVPAGSFASLFEPFRRLTAERTNHRDGAGPGLSIVRSITAAHRGMVSAVPGGDDGLRVDVSLPVGEAAVS